MWQALTRSQLQVLLLKRKFPAICSHYGFRGYTSVSNHYAGPIVISGISGRFPKASSTKELNEKLLKGEELTSETKCRWSSEKLPKRFGFLHCLDKFDAGFFNFTPRQANQTDPQTRLLLEATFEAIVDAGLHPADLRGSDTGVFCGALGSEARDYRLFHYNRDDEGYQTLGTSSCMIAGRIAFSFDLRGPSSQVSTSCSSSLTALEIALHYIREGKCEAAIVTGSVVQLNPFETMDFIALDALAPDGRCKTFDESADGFTRSEAVVAVVVQKEADARRNYVRIKGIGSSTDGFKHAGIMHPTRDTQENLLRKVYAKACVQPSDVSYLEAHGTGTVAGDTEELNAIHRIFCGDNRKREKPLLIGSIKSNIGHTECAAGLCGVAKVIGAVQSGTIPGNLFFNKPNPEIQPLFDGSVKVVTEATTFDGGLVGINSLGIGGTNWHLILEPGPRKKPVTKTSDLPILLPFSGRSETQVEASITEASKHADNPEFVYLLQNAHKRNTPGHHARGFGLVNPLDGKKQVDVVTRCESTTRPVWVVFPGMGSQWSGMGEDLLKIDLFAESIQQSRMTLRNLGVDLDHLLRPCNQSIFTDIHDAFIAIIVMQMALWDTLNGLNIKPDGFIGHSVGEFLCAYADGCYTAEETLQVTHARGRAMKETQKVEGGMSSIGMTADEIKSRLPPRIELACYNTPNNVTISGEKKLVTSFTEKIKGEGRVAVGVSTCGIAAHSSYVREAAALLKDYTEKIIKGDRIRSPRWISSSIPEAEWGSDLAKFASAEYMESNVFQPVLFHQALQHVQSGSVVIEVSPKGFFQALLAETVPRDCINLAPMTAKADNKLWHFFESVGKMYNSGVDVELNKLYPSVSTPVSSNVPSLSHLVKWDHTASWRTSILDIPLNVTHESVIDIEHPTYAYLAGHNIDGRTIMPATGHICGIWNQLGDISGRDYEKLVVQFTNVVLLRITPLNPGVESSFVYKIDTKSGLFSIENQHDIVASGRVEILGEKPKGMGQVGKARDYTSDLVLTKDDLYKEARINGYNYTGLFQGVEAMDGKGHWADVAWNGIWTCFLDSMLHLCCLSFMVKSRHQGLPVEFEKITIDPVEFKEHLSRSFDKTGKNVVRVFQLPNQKKVIAPGIEIKGLELRIVPRVLRHGNVAYERHTFCPFVKTSTDPRTSFEELVDLVLENNKEKRLQVADVFTDKGNSRALEFQRILYRKPRRQDSAITMITLSTEAEKLEDSAKVGRIEAKESRGLLAPQAPTDIVFLDDPTLLPVITPTVITNGFVLVHSTESTQIEDIIGLQKVSTRLVEGKTLDLYRKVELKMPEIVHVSVDSPDFAWVPELQAAILNSKNNNCKIYVTSQRKYETGILGLVPCLREEDGGEKIRCIFDPQGELSLNFDQPDSTLRSIIINDLFVNVQKNGELGSYRHISISETDHQETLSSGNEAFVGPLTPSDMSSLRWIESPLLKPASPLTSLSHLEPCYKRYKVAYSPVNFRDVQLATAAIGVEPEFSYSGPYLGLEFAGFDEDGKRVMGMCHGKALATSVLTDPRFVWEVPSDWTLEQAATVPLDYGTVLYAFHTRARLQPGQTVLIHAGTGGLGQAAINIALAHGCRVFTTVGTPEKREYIKKLFPQITDDYIGNSRDTSFEAQVMEMTEGRGVDVALNSLTGDKLLATVRCVAYNGTFLEMGLADAFKNAQIGSRPLLQNIDVSGVELHRKIQISPGFDKVIKDLMDQGIKSGAVKPLPVRVFESNQVQEAFRTMASGEHMGKLVIKICDENNWKEPLKLPPTVRRSYFSGDKTYLIVGGLGGFGLEVAKWMVERGARKLVLNSRSGITNGYQAFCLRRWHEAGVEVQTPTVDLSNKMAAELFIKELLVKGEIIGGIINSALHLSDGKFSEQTIGNFQTVSKPKGCLTKTLDEISRELCPDLEYFVAFSSFSSGRGNEEQSNYGWANSTMERICEKRRADGLHGLAIQWGIVGQVGYVAETLTKGKDVRFELHGAEAQSVHSCLDILDAALLQPFPVVSSCLVAAKGTEKLERAGFLFRMQKLFGIVDFSTLPAEKKLSELGLDSLVAVELKQLIERDHEISVTKEHLQLLTVADILSMNIGTFDANKFEIFENSQEIYAPFKLHEDALVCLKTHPSDRKAFIVYGTDGGCNNFKPLASRLKANVYGFQFTGKDGWNSIPELAGLYVKEITAREPNGPYTIMGFSAGATTAFEIAHRLKKLDKSVPNLVFLDGCPSLKQTLNRRFAFDMLNTMNILRKLPQDLITSFESSLTGDLAHDILEVFKVLNRATGYELTSEEADAYTFLTEKLAEHAPREAYNGDVTLIQATDPSITIFASGNDYNVSEFCTGQVRVHKVVGNHLTFLREENVDETAGILNALLN